MNLDSEFSFLPFLRMLITVPKVCVCIVLNEMYRRNSEPKCLPPSALLQLIGLLTFKLERNLVKIDVNEQIKWETEEMRLFQDMKMKLLNVVSIFVIILTPIIFRYIPALNAWNQNCATPISIAQFQLRNSNCATKFRNSNPAMTICTGNIVKWRAPMLLIASHRPTLSVTAVTAQLYKHARLK